MTNIPRGTQDTNFDDMIFDLFTRQLPDILKRASQLPEFGNERIQRWRITVDAGRQSVLVCEDESGHTLYSQVSDDLDLLVGEVELLVRYP